MTLVVDFSWIISRNPTTTFDRANLPSKPYAALSFRECFMISEESMINGILLTWLMAHLTCFSRYERDYVVQVLPPPVCVHNSSNDRLFRQLSSLSVTWKGCQKGRKARSQFTFHPFAGWLVGWWFDSFQEKVQQRQRRRANRMSSTTKTSQDQDFSPTMYKKLAQHDGTANAEKRKIHRIQTKFVVRYGKEKVFWAGVLKFVPLEADDVALSTLSLSSSFIPIRLNVGLNFLELYGAVYDKSTFRKIKAPTMHKANNFTLIARYFRLLSLHRSRSRPLSVSFWPFPAIFLHGLSGSRFSQNHKSFTVRTIVCVRVQFPWALLSNPGTYRQWHLSAHSPQEY